MEVWLDSPLAIEATRIFDEQTRECFDEETLALMDAGINPLQFEGLRLAVTSDESKRINEDPAPKVILSASGMCDAGRIRHHLKHNLWRSGLDHRLCRLPGGRYPWTKPAGRCKGCPSVRRRDPCLGKNLPDRRHQRPCRSGRAAALDLVAYRKAQKGLYRARRRPDRRPVCFDTAQSSGPGRGSALQRFGFSILPKGAGKSAHSPIGLKNWRAKPPAAPIPSLDGWLPPVSDWLPSSKQNEGRRQQRPCQIRRPDQRPL